MSILCVVVKFRSLGMKEIIINGLTSNIIPSRRCVEILEREIDMGLASSVKKVKQEVESSKEEHQVTWSIMKLV